MGLDLELCGRRQDGSEFQVNISMSPIDTGDVLLVMAAASDVSERKQALHNAQRMTAIVEDSDDAIIGKTSSGIITSWNAAAEHMYGYSSKEVIGKSIDVISPEDRLDEMKAILKEVTAGRHVSHLETTRIRKDGTALAVSLSVSPVRDAIGTIIGASSIARDVTQARQAFESARNMIESSLDSLVAMSPEGKITNVNEATVKVTGVSRGALIGTDFTDFFTEPDKAREINQRAYHEGVAVYYPLTLRHREGALTDVLYNASVDRDTDGTVRGVFAAARDVSEVSKAFQSARSMIESSLDSLVSISPAGKITDANEATVKVTGVPRGALIGTDFTNYFTEPDKANEIYQQAFANGSAVDYPLTMQHRDGTLTEVLYNASVYRGPEGDVLGVFAAARDVTRQNEALREVDKQRRLELARLAELEQFHQVTVGREIKMIELKKEIESLRRLLPD